MKSKLAMLLVALLLISGAGYAEQEECLRSCSFGSVIACLQACRAANTAERNEVLLNRIVLSLEKERVK